MKLNLGSGINPRDGFVNIDFVKTEQVDLVHDLNEPLPYKEGEIDHIFASHIIEHFWWDSVYSRIQDWFRVLKEGGTCDIWTVDFDLLVYYYMNATEENFLATMKGLNWRMFSDNRPGYPHHALFNDRLLMYFMKQAGFKTVERLHESQYPLNPMHKGINLGVRGTK
jgi:predicted SAM-dependent methyltransferase